MDLKTIRRDIVICSRELGRGSTFQRKLSALGPRYQNLPRLVSGNNPSKVHPRPIVGGVGASMICCQFAPSLETQSEPKP